MHEGSETVPELRDRPGSVAPAGRDRQTDLSSSCRHDELDLIRRFLDSRSEETFRLLYRRHTPALYQFALRLTAYRSADAEDIVQDTWIRAVRGFSGFEGRARLRTWLTGIALNCFRERLRRNRREQTRGPDDRRLRLIANRDTSPSRVDLEAAIAALPSGYREVLLLHDVEGYTHQEVGELLGIESGTSKSQLFRARRALRKHLTSGGKSDE